MASASVIALGLPNSGKSTFIAALGYVLQHQEIPTILSVDRLADDLSYINPLVSDWLRCITFERTKTLLNDVTFHLRDSSGPIGSLSFPDISGETFELHWELREWDQDFARLARSASGILLFIHPNIEKPFSVVDQARIAKAAIVDEEPEPQSEENSGGTSTALSVLPIRPQEPVWKPREASSQSKLVDLLQMISLNSKMGKPLRLGLVISAWDVVIKRDSAIAPSKWIEETAPLLHQFVSMNPERFEVRAFGISAQGGDNQEDGEVLRTLNDPSKRIIVVGQDCREHDITAPLAWILKTNA